MFGCGSGKSLLFLVSQLNFTSARVILGSSETLQKLDLAVFHGLTKHIANIEPNTFR
jgi:hypothetical protein